MNDSLKGSMGVGLSINTAAAQALSLLVGVGRAAPPASTRAASLKVEQASDNAAYWSIATTVKVDGLSLSSAEAATSRASALVDTAALGLADAATLLDQIRSTLVAAKRSDISRSGIGARLDVLKEKLLAVADQSEFDGENWLSLPAGRSPNVEAIVASVSRTAAGELSVNVIDFDTSGAVLVSRHNPEDGLLTRRYSVVAANGEISDYVLLGAGAAGTGDAVRPVMLTPATSNNEIDGMITAVDLMSGYVAAAATALETTAGQVIGDIGLDDVQASSTSPLDAGLDDQGAIELALKASEQLQAQSLPIANSVAGSFKLFL
ncbi:hypothetical protein [Ciceribacter sp. L1K22]|uniref:flagellin N-terminal helical domain-containing protein n=1 Tax=Ciceribacter sp. L1K22 TaxID=2820275 RepID=UPI001ABE6789|nr:hypothetical protein [Ciceribacter sp. L1K22]